MVSGAPPLAELVGTDRAFEILKAAPPDVMSHNLETEAADEEFERRDAGDEWRAVVVLAGRTGIT